jgi:cation diffusion facilitator family transporter
MLSEENRYHQIRIILWVILALNWAVALIKIFYGIFSRCTSITADGFHSLSDGASNVICLIGIGLASRPRDIDHPYGHKKYETFFSLGIAALLSFVAINLFKEGFRRLNVPSIPIVDYKSFAVMLLTTFVNIAVMKYEYKKGRALDSDLLISDSLHTKADILTSVSVIIALVFMKMGYPIFDPIVTIMISLFIGYSVFEIVKYSANILCDRVAIIETKKIVDIVLGINGVLNCHKIRTRGRPDDINIDLHVQVSPDMRMDKAHQISYQIEEALKKGYPGVVDVIVHMEPKENKLSPS